MSNKFEGDDLMEIAAELRRQGFPLTSKKLRTSPTPRLDNASRNAVVHGPFSEQYRELVQPVLKLEDELRKLTELEEDINVPTIVAIGDQSHGKSSCELRWMPPSN